MIGDILYGSQLTEYFGLSVSLSSDGTIAIATGFDVTGSNSEGAVFVYQYNGSSWALLGGRILMVLKCW